MGSPLTLAGGLAMGLAASLHCVGMCGGIAAMSLAPAGAPRSIGHTALVVHAGRVTAYALLGATAGGIGSAAIHGLEPSLGHHLLRWAAALSLSWIGLSTAGLMPGPAILARLAPACAGGLNLRGQHHFLAGLGWGLVPCGMVYGALLYALFTGSAWAGALVMVGFGLGTLPALIGAAACFGWLNGVRRSPAARMAAGLAIALLGPASLVLADPAVAAACKASIGL